MSEQSEREEFERFIREWFEKAVNIDEVLYRKPSGFYKNMDVFLAWEAWKKRATEAEKQRHILMDGVKLILRLARRVRVLAASDEMPTKAVEFLQKHDLMGSPFRLKETEK